MAKKKSLTEREMALRLAIKYGSDEWVFLPGVRSAAGFDAKREADAVAMNLWPSRGLAVHGFELKSTRSDWLKELRSPEKADVIGKYCDHWWIVTGTTGIVKDGELPLTWGLMEPYGADLRIKVGAPKQENPEPLDRSFMAAMLKAAKKHALPDSIAEAKAKKAYDEGLRDGRSNAKYDLEAFEAINEKYTKIRQTFLNVTGLDLNSWNVKEVAASIKFARQYRSPDKILEALESVMAPITRLADGVKKELEGLRSSLNEDHSNERDNDLGHVSQGQ